MAYTTIPASSGGGGGTVTSVASADGSVTVTGTTAIDLSVVAVTPAAVALSRARTLLGNTLNSVNGTDFENDQWYSSLAVATIGTASLLQNQTSGVLELATGATSAHGTLIIPHAASANVGASYVANGRTSRWYVVARMQFNTAMTAQTVACLQLTNPGASQSYQNIRWGINSAATNLAYQSVDNVNAGLASATTTTAFDNAWHTFEIYNDTTTMSFAYDSAVIATTASTNIYAGAFMPSALVYNGTDSVTRKLWIDYLYMVTVGN